MSSKTLIIVAVLVVIIAIGLYFLFGAKKPLVGDISGGEGQGSGESEPKPSPTDNAIGKKIYAQSYIAAPVRLVSNSSVYKTVPKSGYVGIVTGESDSVYYFLTTGGKAFVTKQLVKLV